MKHLLTQEVAQAILKGERDYAALLDKMDLVRVEVKKVPDKKALSFIEKCLRDAA